MTAAYDAGAWTLAAAGDRELWADHRARLESGHRPVTTAPVVSQVSRSPRQVQLHRFLKGCDVLAMTESDAHSVGALLGACGTSDVVDAHLVHAAVAEGVATILTSDPGDIGRLMAERGARRVRIQVV